MAIKTVKAIVAPRRTVVIDGKGLGPGAEVMLPADEVAHLRAQGFLINPFAGAAPAQGAGPSFGTPTDTGEAAGSDEE